MNGPAAIHGSSDGVENDPARITALVDLFKEISVSRLVGNLETRVEQVEIAGRSFPLTVNDGKNPHNCYICCPSAAYVDYAIDETRNFLSRPWVRLPIVALIRACAVVVRASGLDRQTQLNNWLFSTNPVPRLDRSSAAAIRDELTKRHPDKAIVIRSLNDIADGATLAALKAEGFYLLAARQVYIAPALSAFRMSKEMKADRSKLRRTPYSIVGDEDFHGDDYGRCRELYDMLYIRKYTPLNPQYTETYLQEMHRRGLLRLAGLRGEDGRLVGVTGLFENGATLTQPIVGYDTTLPPGAALYRMLMAMAQDHAAARGLFFNMSAGAADFKRRRGALPAIEYSAVFVRHLPLSRRIAVRIMEAVLSHIGIPLLRRFKL